MKFNPEKSYKQNEDNSNPNNKATGMYLHPELAAGFAQREKEDTKEHSVVSRVLDNTVTDLFKDEEIKIANLGAGANPQKYEGILKKLKEGSHLDWVDISPKMLEIASKEVSLSSNEISFIENNFTGYLNSQEDGSLDCVMMQYAINYIDNLENFFEILSKKLKDKGVLIANIGAKKPLRNNQYVSFLVNDKEFTGEKYLVDGDHYTIRFLNLDGSIFASTEKNFFSDKKIEATSEEFGLELEIRNIDGTRVLVVKK